MGEKLVTFLFAGILGVMFYHAAAAAVLHRFFAMSSAALVYWYVPLIALPALLLLALAWVLGFGRRGSSLWGNVTVLAATAAIVFFAAGPPYNCWNQFCF